MKFDNLKGENYMKKRVLIALIIFLIIIEITFAGAIYTNSDKNLIRKNNKFLKIKKSDISSKDIKINFKNDNLFKSKKALCIYPLDNEGNQTHPALDKEKNGNILAAYEDTRINDIAWTHLSEGGTYIEGVFFGLEGMIKFPAIDYWGSDKRFFGTAVPSLKFYDGGILPIFYCSDVTEIDTYNLEFVDWGKSGFSQIKDVDIACDDSKNDWEFGTLSLIANKDNNMYTGPCVCYMDPNNSEEIHISWYDEYNACNHTMCNIDKITQIAYSVYDCLESNDQNYKLLLRYDDFGNWNSGEQGIVEISIDGVDLKYPTIAINNNTIVILAVAIEENKKDIICIYSYEGINGNFHSTYVVNSNSFEGFPRISHIAKNKFLCTFLKNQNYYISQTDNGGKTWRPSRQINDKNGTVVEGYKNTDLSKKANFSLWEDISGENIDLNFCNCLQPVNIPNIPYGPDVYICTSTCMCCEQYPGYFGGKYSTIGTDIYALKLKYKFHWGINEGYSDWTDFYDPGIECNPVWNCYYFGGPGNKIIKIRVKSMDENGYESPWSDPLEVVLVWTGGFGNIMQYFASKYLYKGIF
jgi:uncharacterized protein YxeA